MDYNTLLDNTQRAIYGDTIKKLFTITPEMMSRKIPEANVQQAFIFDAVVAHAKDQESGIDILSVGCFEDTASDALMKLAEDNTRIEGIDPSINYDLNTFFNLPSTKKNKYDIIFSTSVLEHVEDDETFIKQVYELLKPGGVCFLTVDFNDNYKPGGAKPIEDFRLYTIKDLNRLLSLLGPHELIDKPQWHADSYDFWYGQHNYTFATLSFRKL
jgi:SAM-dependent methyltransferase